MLHSVIKEQILKGLYEDGRGIVAAELERWAPQAEELARQLIASNYTGDVLVHPQVVRQAHDLITEKMDCAFAPMSFGWLVEGYYIQLRNPTTSIGATTERLQG